MTVLAAAFRGGSMPGLQHLDASSNRIFDSGCAALLTTIKDGLLPALRTLDLSRNPCTLSENTQLLAEATRRERPGLVVRASASPAPAEEPSPSPAPAEEPSPSPAPAEEPSPSPAPEDEPSRASASEPGWFESLPTGPGDSVL